LSSI
jgi:hypothetical protein